MKTEELKAIQAPIKDRYKTQPGAALITLKAQGRLGEGVTCSVNGQGARYRGTASSDWRRRPERVLG